MPQKIKPTQVDSAGITSGYVLKTDGTTTSFGAATGQQVDTQYLGMSGGSASKTSAGFGFVVGMCFIEFLDVAGNNENGVKAAGWINMRSHSGTKTADITDRRFLATGSASNHPMFLVSRSTSGTVIDIKRPDYGDIGIIANDGAASTNPTDWNASGTIRVTAYEDMQGDAA